MNNGPELTPQQLFSAQGDSSGEHPPTLLASIPSDSLAMSYLRDALGELVKSSDTPPAARALIEATLKGEVPLSRMLNDALFLPSDESEPGGVHTADQPEEGIRWG
ncbi:hypothetical protein [Mycetocola spongiae]|uniref:hypothetical protein n=1 Tax=Mycetocola spongiae TaxID=2859226 RepID=UPI001CF1E57C|nr:hypothetical protein [Mycetocola spongiae]UCR88616.1 hypothetical protein KXZ72_11710 [Mycetocola spongiae]